MIWYIKVGSITNAQRSRKILAERGYKAQIKRADNLNADDGCGWVVAVRSSSDEPVKILKNAGINVKGAESK